MKRVWISVLVLTIFLSVMIVPASAAVVTETITYEFVDPYDNYIQHSEGNVLFRYRPYLSGGPRATTAIYMPSGATGRVLTFISCNSQEARNSDSNDVVSNVVQCTIALSHYYYATKTVHYANRTMNGNFNAWEYTYVSSAHQTSAAELEILNTMTGQVN